jgi:hypothetical protein
VTDVELVVTREDVLRTRVTLAGLQARQDAIRAGLNRSGIDGTADRLDWLFSQRSPDEVLAWTRRWRDLGVARPEPIAESFARPRSLSVPRAVRTPRRKKSEPVIPKSRQLEIAMAALATREARKGGTEDAA